MRWHRQSRTFRLYLLFIYFLAAPIAVFCLLRPEQFAREWILLALTSIFIATINIRLPKISSVISMGDVFIILSLIHFGPGPAIITSWIIVTGATLTDVLRKHG